MIHSFLANSNRPEVTKPLVPLVAGLAAGAGLDVAPHRVLQVLEGGDAQLQFTHVGLDAERRRHRVDEHDGKRDVPVARRPLGVVLSPEAILRMYDAGPWVLANALDALGDRVEALEGDRRPDQVDAEPRVAGAQLDGLTLDEALDFATRVQTFAPEDVVQVGRG